MTVNPNLVLINSSLLRSQRNETSTTHPYFALGSTQNTLGQEMILIDKLQLQKWLIVPVFSDNQVSFVDVEYRINELVRFTERFLVADLTPRVIPLLDEFGDDIFLEKGEDISYTLTAPNSQNNGDRSTFIVASWGTWQRSD